MSAIMGDQKLFFLFYLAWNSAAPVCVLIVLVVLKAVVQSI